MELSLELKQVQKLSPQMIQSMNILQMGTLELQEYVEKTLLENPTLELEPEVKAGHSLLSFAAHGACWDWCSSNHRELIDSFLQEL